MINTDFDGDLSKALVKRIANIDRIDTLLAVMNAINELTLSGFINHDEYVKCSIMLEKTRNYLIAMGQRFKS